MQNNYKPWSLDYKVFFGLATGGERLKFLLRFALLAPSSHNSQPWRFHITGDQIVVYPELSRALPKSDKNDRQLFISLGAALANLLVAANFYGYRSKVRYMPNEFSGAAFVVRLLEVEINNSINRDERIVKSIISRHSNRNKYSDRILSDEFIESIKSASGDQFRVYVIQDKKIKNKIADIVIDANVEAMDDSDFRFELSSYVKSNVTKSKIGMPMFGFGVPTLLSFLAPFLLRRFNLNRLSRSQDEELLKEHTPYFVIITSRVDDKESWIKAGEIFESIALMAERDGVRTASMAAPIQIGENYKKMQLLLSTEMRPQVFFRMGYSEEITPHSPRLSLEDISQDDE